MIAATKKTISPLPNLLLLAALLLPILVLPLNAWSQVASSVDKPSPGKVAIGTVLSSSGEVIAQSAGVDRELARRDSVYVGDKLSTGPGARVRFKLSDDSTYVIQENSNLTIERYHYSGSEDGTEVAEFYFSEGVMEFVSGYIGKQDQTRFRIDTEFAVIGLRGSGGIITTNSESTQVFVTLGQLTAVSKGGQLFVLNNGQTTVVDSDGDAASQQGNGTGAEQTMSTDGNDISAEPSDDASGDAGQSEEADQENQAEQVSEADESIAAQEADEANDADDSTQNTAGNGLTDTGVSAAEIYTELLPIGVEATQDDLAQALDEAVEAYPVLYAELVTVAIEAGLEPPTAALTATDALGGSGSISEQVLTEIFFVSTEGLVDTAEVEAALITEGSPLVVQPTQTSAVGLDSGSIDTPAVPTNNATPPVIPASPAQ